MSLFTLFDQPLFNGIPSSRDVPYRFPVGIAGHAYMADLMSDQTGLRGQYFRRASIPVLRSQANTTNLPDESSLSPDDMWRRTQDSWHLGAGQSYFDRSGSDPNRFRSSKGVNVWTKWQASLLPDTSNAVSSANNVVLVTAGTYVYLMDGQTLKYSTNITTGSPTTTTVTGTPANTPTAIASDGNTVYVSYTTALYTTTRGAGAATASSVTQAFSVLAYMKSRLMGASGASIYNITSLGSNPTALFTHANSDFTWVGFTGAGSQIYAAGYSGDKSLIYQTAVKADGTALDIPKVAGELPDGEIIRCIYGYANVVVIGSDSGVRVATINGDGSLNVNGPILIGSVRCLSGHDRFVWFGWTNYDGSSTGLGRIDLANFTAPGIPAYASDLMATTQGIVRSVIQTNGLQVFSVDAAGVFAPTVNLVASGSIDSGTISYDLADQKVGMFLDVRSQPLNGTITSSLSVDRAAFGQVGQLAAQGISGPTTAFGPMQQVGELFEVRHTLAYGANHATGPVMTRYTLRSYPTPDRSFQWVVPLLLHESVDSYGDGAVTQSVQAEIDYLFGLLAAKQLVSLQIGSATYQVFVEDVIQLPFQVTANHTSFDSTVIVSMKQPSA